MRPPLAPNASTPRRPGTPRAIVLLATVIVVLVAIAGLAVVDRSDTGSATSAGEIYVVRNVDGRAVLTAIDATPTGARAGAGANLPQIAHDGFSTFGDAGLQGRYTVEFVDSPNIEQVRPHLMASLGQATRVAGLSFGVVDRLTTDAGGPVHGVIDIVVSETSACSGSWLACGGPSVEGGVIVAGRIWVHPRLLSRSSGDIANTIRHELGHALGLGHYSGSYRGKVQTMHPTSFAATDFEAGDAAGLRYLRERYAPGSTAGLTPTTTVPVPTAPASPATVPGEQAASRTPTTTTPSTTTTAPSTTTTTTTAPADEPASGPGSSGVLLGSLEPLVDSSFGLVIRGWAGTGDDIATVSFDIDGRTVVIDADLTLGGQRHDGNRFQLLYVAPAGEHTVCATMTATSGVSADLGCSVIETTPATKSVAEYRAT